MPAAPPAPSPVPLASPAPPDDLRAALVATTVALLRDHAPGELSLRDVARRLGVSSGAPYHHFEDKPALLAAVAAEGWEGLHGGLDAALAATEARPAPERLRALGEAYLAFALARPELYRVLFLPELAERPRFDALHARSVASLGRLVCVVAAGIGRPTDDAVTLERAVACWATLHGYALLATGGALRARTDALDDRRAVAAAVDGAVRAALGALPDGGAA